MGAMPAEGGDGLLAASDLGQRLNQIRDDVIRGLFEVTLELGTALELVADPTVRSSLSQVIGKTDDLIREVRLVMMNEVSRNGD